MKLPQTARRVVITGMSAISPLGSSWADVRSALLHNRSGIQHMTEWEDLQGLNTRVGAPAAPFELDPEFFTRKRTRSMGRGLRWPSKPPEMRFGMQICSILRKSLLRSAASLSVRQPDSREPSQNSRT